MPGLIGSLHADVVVDCRPLTRTDARVAIEATPEDVRFVVLSSQDVYRAFESFQRGIETDAVPVDERAPLRTDRYPYRGQLGGYEDYSKLDVEDEYAARGAVILRLPAVYGERDRQRREEFVLRRVRAGRRRIPFGSGSLLWTRADVRDVARGVRLAVEGPEPTGIFNFGEALTWSISMWAERILEAAGWEAELVTVAEEALPDDLELTRTPSQHLLFDSGRARRVLGYADADLEESTRRSVAWHLAHPPTDAGDFTSDDDALARRRA
jgi:nucleoside-diphosphate-sugar epimerase